MKALKIIAAAATFVGAAAHPALPATEGTVKTACQVEVDADAFEAAKAQTEVVAFMKRVEGPVSILRPDGDGFEEIQAFRGMDLFAQDAVISGAGVDTGFDLIFTDATTISGVANTCMEISKYLYKPQQKKGEMRVRLGRGVIALNAGKVAKLGGDTMSVRVRNDTNLAVTGTRLIVRAQ
ncbi:MAG: hypothetical protein AAF401_15275 [Pseudomonadota bacterium]